MSEYYEIRIRSHLDRRWSDWFAGLQLTHLGGNETLLSGSLPDQAALHGLLERIRDLNLVLISVNCSRPQSSDKEELRMKTLIISYSHTGNNEALATSLALTISADHVRITEQKCRKMGTIVWDIMLKRTPKITMPPVAANAYDVVLFVGPVWMGQVASPFRSCFSQLQDSIGDYGFLAISGGADGPNPKLRDELTERLGHEPLCLIDLHIADLLPPEPALARKDTMAHRLTETQIASVAQTALEKLQGALSEEMTPPRVARRP